MFLRFWPFWCVLGRFGVVWVVFGWFWSFWVVLGVQLWAVGCGLCVCGRRGERGGEHPRNGEGRAGEHILQARIPGWGEGSANPLIPPCLRVLLLWRLVASKCFST